MLWEFPKCVLLRADVTRAILSPDLGPIVGKFSKVQDQFIKFLPGINQVGKYNL